jgi:hypothetical protein
MFLRNRSGLIWVHMSTNAAVFHTKRKKWVEIDARYSLALKRSDTHEMLETEGLYNESCVIAAQNDGSRKSAYSYHMKV